MGLVRKDGYFSITDACIKHRPANFLIIRTPKLFLYYFPFGCEKAREGRRGRLRELLDSKSQAAPEKPLAGGWSEVEGNPTGREADRAGPMDTRNSGVGGRAHRLLSHTKPRSALLNFDFLIGEKGMCLASQPFVHYWSPFHWISLVMGWQKPRTPSDCPSWLLVCLFPKSMSWRL